MYLYTYSTATVYLRPSANFLPADRIGTWKRSEVSPVTYINLEERRLLQLQLEPVSRRHNLRTPNYSNNNRQSRLSHGDGSSVDSDHSRLGVIPQSTKS